MPALVTRRAREHPDRTAVVHGARSQTYGELAASARSIARRLRDCGVDKDVPVPLWLDRSPELVAAALGVLLAGGAYVGMDTADPPARVASVLADCAAPVVLTTRALAATLPPGPYRTLLVDGHEERGESREHVEAAHSTTPAPAPSLLPASAPAPRQAGPADLCYVTFTSGSTGRPKGVLVHHAGVASLVDWYMTTFGITHADRMPQLARPSFDGWALEVWPCLAAGATLHVADARLPDSPQALVDWITGQGVTVAFFTTALAGQLLAAHWAPGRAALRAMLLGGERLHAPPAVQPPFRLYHVYGPTETTMLATCGEITAAAPRDLPPPIGRPLPGLTAEVLDEHRAPVPDGGTGELHLSGIQVAHGYLRDAGLTAERFHHDPRTGVRRYATGDLVRLLPSGDLDFVGRTDHQIKVRGFRVEPGEIETALLGMDEVAQAAVVAHESAVAREPASEAAAVAPVRRLVAYWVARETDGAPGSTALRDRLAHVLPRHMVPHLLVRLDALPLTTHGKTDRHSLAAREPREEGAPGAPGGQGGRSGQDGRSTPPAYLGRTEELLAELWCKVLEVPSVDREDSFFDLGGDSLLAMRLAAEGRRHGLRFGAEDLFDTEVLHELATALTEREESR